MVQFDKNVPVIELNIPQEDNMIEEMKVIVKIVEVGSSRAKGISVVWVYMYTILQIDIKLLWLGKDLRRISD